MKTAFSRLLIVLLLVIGYASAQEDLPVFCHETTIPTTWPKETAAIITGSDLVFASSGRYSTTKIAFKNAAQEPISQIIMLVELFSETGRHVLTFNVYSNIALAPKTSLPEYLRYSHGDLDASGKPGVAVFPGDTAALFPTSARIVTECPAEARVGLVRLKYLGGKTFSYSSETWRTDPTIIALPPLDSKNLPVKKSFDKLITVRVNESQTAYVPSLEDVPEGFSKWLHSQIREWKFIRGTFAGKPVTDDLRLLIRFHDKAKEDYAVISAYKEESEPFAVLDIYPPTSSGHRPNIVYGGLPLID